MSTFVEADHPRGQIANAGQFTSKVNDAPAGQLVAERAPASEFGPVQATIIFQELGADDMDIEIDRAQVDIGAVLDGRDIEDLPDSSEDLETIDGLFPWAQNLGLVGEHEGPYEVYLEEGELEAYRDAREAKGRTSAITSLPTAPADERKERFNTLLKEHLPAGGISAVMAWNDDDATKWIGEARTAVTQKILQGHIQPAFLEEDDKKMLAALNDAALASYLTSRDTEKIRQTAVDLYQHLATTRW